MSTVSMSSSVRAILTILMVAVGANALACADGEFRFGDPFDRELTLSDAQHRYTVLIRWTEFQKARKFVAEPDRDDFMDQMKKLSDARITSYESSPVELDKGKKTSTVEVVYTLYTPSVPYEIEITEQQEWSRSGVGNSWSVISTFEGLQQLASN